MSLLFLHNDYNSGLFGCFDDQPSCFDGFFCPCCALSAQYNMLKHRQTGMLAHVWVPLSIVNFFTWGLAVSCFSVVTRNMLRRGFSLSEETELDGCCKACFCAPCSICQVYREMSMRQVWPDGVCVDAPYTKRGLVLAAPNPDRMGVQQSRSAVVQPQPHHQEQVERQHQQHQPSHVGRESSYPANGQPVYGYPMQPVAQQHPTKPVYGYDGVQPPAHAYPVRQQQPPPQPRPHKNAA
jgi:Cys-rich protein (TIGR01571 family)